MKKTLPFFILALWSCNERAIVKNIPYKHDFTTFYAKKVKEIDSLRQSKYENYDDNPEKLGNEDLVIKEKYAILLSANPKDITHYALYRYIDDWLGTPYKKEAMDKTGVDCSYFIQALFNEVYRESLPKSPASMRSHPGVQSFTGRAFLKEGDLLFFRYAKESAVSDVGLYLRNDRILACGLKDGLNIYDFNDDYFQARFICAGRLAHGKK